MTTAFNYKTVSIPSLDAEAMKACRKRIDNLCKPIYSLAQLEVMAERLAGITGLHKPNKLKTGMVIFAADHIGGTVDAIGMDSEDHSNADLYDLSYAELARMEVGNSATDAVARKLQATVTLVDMGLVRDTSDLQSVRRFNQANATDGIQEAMQVGYQLSKELSEQGVQIVGLGNIGVGARITAETITNLDMPALLLDLLDKSKGYDIAAMVGFILGAAESRMAIVIDNEVTGSAAVVASVLNEQVKHYLFASAVYDTDTHRSQMAYLGLRSYLYYDFSIAEGLGSAMGISLLDASLHMLNDMKTFAEAAVAVAEDGPGNGIQVL